MSDFVEPGPLKAKVMTDEDLVNLNLAVRDCRDAYMPIECGVLLGLVEEVQRARGMDFKPVTIGTTPSGTAFYEGAVCIRISLERADGMAVLTASATHRNPVVAEQVFHRLGAHLP